MKAIIISKPGGPEVLSYEDVLDPVPGTGEILIQVRSVGVNNADLLQRRGLYPPPPGASSLMGLEVAGEVVAIGPDVSLWSKGDRVMALLSGGGYAEKVVVHESLVMPIPKGVEMEDAGAIPEAFLTAWLELVTLGQLRQGESVLIHAGGSGVGTAAIQIAKNLGSQIYVTAGSEQKLARCRELGAAVAINYKTQEFDSRILAETEGEGVHCILDLVGASHWRGNINALAFDGRLLLVGLSGGSKTEVDLRPLLSKRIRVIGSTLRGRSLKDKASLIMDFTRNGLPLFSDGRLKPVIDRRFPLKDAAEAHRHVESGAHFGKVVLQPT